MQEIGPTLYAVDTSRWENWQQEYRYGMLLIVPPDPVYTQVNRLRAMYDPRSQASFGAHISITVPLPGPMASAHWRELETIAAGVAPFEIEYGPLRHYLPFRGVVLSIEPQDTIDRLRQSLEAATAFSGAAPRRHSFSAHMTIAEFITVEQTTVLMNELGNAVQPGSFTCDSVMYVVPDESFVFSERRRLALGAHSLQEER
jgi:2'-5' RNA ligase